MTRVLQRRGAGLTRWVGVAGVVAGAAAPSIALAGPEDADSLVRHGLELRRERRDAEALSEFRRAYALRAEPRCLTQIALAEQALGQWAKAEDDLQQALDADADPWIVGHRPALADGLAEIRRHLGAIEVDCNVSPADLWINGERASTLPLAHPLRVEAGSVIVEVRAAGFTPARRFTSVEAGEVARETVHLVPAQPALPAQPAEPAVTRSVAPLAAASTSVPSAHTGARAASFVLLGSALLDLAAGTYFGVRTLSAKADRDAHCHPGCDAAGVASDNGARALAERSTAWFALGALAAGAGVGLFWVSRGAVSMEVGPATLRVRSTW